MVMEKQQHQIQKTILKKQKSLPFPARDKLKVHFADGCGLSLVSVHKISMDDLTLPTIKVVNEATKELQLTFPQPVTLDDYTERLSRRSVSLENVVVSNCTIMGTIKVKNITYHKTVFVRYTYNLWESYEETMANYVQDSCDGTYDRFSFGLTVPPELNDGDRMEFAICYKTSCPDNEFWDSNDGANYIIECKGKCVPRNSSFGVLWNQLIPNYKR